MDIIQATQDYEAWLGARLTLIPEDLKLKHQHMAEGVFPFLRATFYRWIQTWPATCPDVSTAPTVLAVGDLHSENFGTWRDAEGRLIWGLNDFDEVHPMPYTIDLVRLATSVCLAIEEEHLTLLPEDACKAILKGYQESLLEGGRPFVLAENYPVLREWATARLRDPGVFWEKINSQPSLEGDVVPQEVHDVLRRYLPEPGLSYRVVHRIAGLGSLGRQRFVALAQWRGGNIAREAKALVPSASTWQQSQPCEEIFYEKALTTAVRTVDPWVHLAGRWIVRRLSPDCRRIELESLPENRNELKLLTAMGRETANIHLGSGAAVKRSIGEDLEKRDRKWLRKAAQAMVDSVRDDWRQWRKEGMN
ncbi:MAG: DUF2252 family protein [Thermoguttaceae bacterium]|jgi:hypothetical protein